MRIAKVEPKDICITIELSSEQLGFIIDVIDHSEIKINRAEEPEMIKKQDYFVNEFYGELNKLNESLKRGPF